MPAFYFLAEVFEDGSVALFDDWDGWIAKRIFI